MWHGVPRLTLVVRRRSEITLPPNSTNRAWYTTGMPILRLASSAARMSATSTPCTRRRSRESPWNQVAAERPEVTARVHAAWQQ